MGGSIAVTVREPNGTEHRMCRWTNAIPWFMKNIRLLNKDPAHIREYLKDWQDMRADYEKHKDEWEALKQKYGDKVWDHDGPFEFPMTDAYAPYPFLAPLEYGLVVFDMQKNHILDYQGYTSPDAIDSVAVVFDMSSVSPGKHKIVVGGPQPEKLGRKAFYLQDDESNAVRFRELLEAGRITKAVNYRTKETISLDGKSLDDAIKVIEDDSERHVYFPIDMSPYEVTRYIERDPEEAQKMHSRIKDLGFQLSDEEERLWEEWIKEHKN